MKVKQYASGGIVYTPFISSSNVAPQTMGQTPTTSVTSAPKSDNKDDNE